MAIDLLVGILVITALSVLSYVAGRVIRLSRVSVYFVASLLTCLFFAWTLSGKLGWAALMPGSSVVFWSNLMPILLCFAAGLASETPSRARISRFSTVVALLLLAAAYALIPYSRPVLAPVSLGEGSSWQGDVCLQSHPSTCAPAAAATLLRLSGIEAGEQELVRACLTSSYGTEPLGLYRGLALSTRGPLVPRVADSDPLAWERRGELPNIALVRFETPSREDHVLARHERRGSLRWLLGPRSEGHAIVVLGQDGDGNWQIADPAIGTTTWSRDEFLGRFTGDAIYLANTR